MRRRRRLRRTSPIAAALLAARLAVSTAGAQEASVRAVLDTNRWTEDWSPLADLALRTRPFDALKYIRLSADDAQSYLSLGATLRERFEFNDVAAFGTGVAGRDSYLLQRLQLHADLHLDQQWRIFVQFEDVRAPGKRNVTPADTNPLDLRLLMLEYNRVFADSRLRARIGRQEFAFDLQRFISSREGPNVRQSFDAAWVAWEGEAWRVIGFFSHPVVYAAGGAFDDRSYGGFRFHLLRAERKVFGDNELSTYYARYDRDDAHFGDAVGAERRDILDIRFAGKGAGLDWDLEAMGQGGTVGRENIRAWAAGSRAGYTFAGLHWSPRLGMQADAASGDGRARDGRLGTFNPLFPNGYYFSLAGYTGYANLLHLKPSITVQPAAGLKVLAAVGLQWRQTVSDAIYVQPDIALRDTAGRGNRWSGRYLQVRADYTLTPNLIGAVEAVRYDIGSTIRASGGADATFVGVELKYAW